MERKRQKKQKTTGEEKRFLSACGFLFSSPLTGED